jgi:hypothetical protein
MSPARRLPPRLARLATAVATIATLAFAPLRAGSPAEMTAQPLAPRSGPPGATLFKLMPAAGTGVLSPNRYADPRMWTDHYQELAYGEIGTGVTIGDYDNDGRPDIYVVNKTEPGRLFRNLGGWKFQDVTAAAGLEWMKPAPAGEESANPEREHWNQGVTFVDVNNDGWLDLYICRFDAPNLLYVNQRDGTFKEEAAARGLALRDASGMAAFCDYDRDGALDVYIHTSLLDAATKPNGQRDRLFHNRGDGTFEDVSDRAGISGEAAGHSATWWDYDEDGWPDLYVANDYAPADHLYHNNRDGTFRDVIDRVVPHTPYYAMGADLGDVNNDGHVDFLVADMAPTTHEKDQRGMAGSRARAQLPPTDPRTAPQYMANALYVSTGAGVCLEVARLAGVVATDWTWSPRFEDLDNDGRLDLHVTNGMTREYHNADLLDRIMAAESPLESRRMMRSSPPLAEANLAFRNLGNLQFENVAHSWGLDQKGVSFGSAFGDLDGDGDLDLVYGNYLGNPTLLRNDSPAGHRLVVALRGTSSNRYGVGSTVRIETSEGVQVRTLVLARGVLSSSEPILHFGLGQQARIHRLVVNWPNGRVQELSGVAADQKLTITEPAGPVEPAKPASRPAAQFEDVSTTRGLALQTPEGGSGERQPLIGVRPDRRGPALAVVRAEAGAQNLVLGAVPGGSARLLRRSAAGGTGFQAVPLPIAAVGPVLAFDVDGDGRDDVLTSSSISGGERLELWLARGPNQFEPASADALPALDLPVGALAAADFNRDGHLDCFVGARSQPGEYPLAGHSALLAHRNGRLVDVTAELAPGLADAGLVTAALWSDVDGDGWSDLLVAVEWGAVRYWHNRTGRGFDDWTERAGFAAGGTGWWTALASADFNGDGRPDFVAGNLGLNTRYHASPSHPALLYRGEFGSRTPLSVEAHDEDGRICPWVTRNELAPHVPAVLKRYPRVDDYARATLPEILGADRLAAARRFAATELQSGVFLSQPDGSYRFEPLPRIAQVAPASGLAVGDFDGDGHTDVYLVQNSFAPQPSVGRFDGGVSQLLRGDGHGHFVPIAPAESGLLVTGDARAVVVIDLDDDGWPDFVISRRDNTSVAYRNRAVAGRHSFQVRLRTTATVPVVIGAQVTVAYADGSTATAETQSGSGGWSQSGDGLFFGYDDANPPREIRVRWPDGATTAHAFQSDQPLLTLSR